VVVSASIFTAAEIAAALGRKRESIGRSLSSHAPSGTKVVSGNEARAWSVAALPGALLGDLQRLTVQLGCKDVETFLRQSGEPWSPSVPLARCHDESVEAARKLREALRPSLQREEAGMKGAEFEAQGIEDYQRVFNYPITARHFRDLLTRTLRRAGMVHDLEKLDLYLAERPKAREAATPAPVAASGDDVAKQLRSLAEGFSQTGNPSPREREALWTEALLAHDSLLANGDSTARAGRRIRAALAAVAPSLAAGTAALQKAFLRKLGAWRASGGDAKAVRDGRRENTGNHDGYELPAADYNVLVNLAVWQFPGHLAAAWRAGHQRGLLTPATVARYPLSGPKSYVPRKIREAIASDVELMRRMKLHQKAASDLVPHVSRTYEALASCQVFNADDVTLPVYSYVPNRDGWFDLVRGQCLLFIDLRSLKIVGWSFQQDPNYSSLVIRTLCTRIFSELCVPRVLHFESGIWKNSKLLTGKNADGAVPGVEVIQGMRELGVEFVNSHTPRAKPVERVIGQLQDLMEAERGFCGRDERRDLPSHTKKAMDDVKFHRRHPSELFYSFDQWHDRLAQIIALYNATPQEGRLDGLSPDAAFDKFMDPSDPPMQLPPELRFLLAHHKEEREVKTSGLQFKVGKNVFRYFGEALGPLVGRRVLAWFDPENPEHLVVTDLDRKNPVLVPRAQNVPAMATLTGGTELLESELARAQGQMAHLRARYNVVKGALPLPHRAVLTTRSQVKTGQQIAALREQRKNENHTVDRVSRRARKLGMHVPNQSRGSEAVDEATRYLETYLKNGAEQ
jgi:hypothetical protein